MVRVVIMFLYRAHVTLLITMSYIFCIKILLISVVLLACFSFFIPIFLHPFYVSLFFEFFFFSFKVYISLLVCVVLVLLPVYHVYILVCYESVIYTHVSIEKGSSLKELIESSIHVVQQHNPPPLYTGGTPYLQSSSCVSVRL